MNVKFLNTLTNFRVFKDNKNVFCESYKYDLKLKIIVVLSTVFCFRPTRF